MTALSERQRRELKFYEEFSKMHTPQAFFASISGKETRPWNSYWRVVEIAKQNFRSDDQKLLDFGCGKGELSLVLSKIGYEVFGFDLSPNVRFCGERRDVGTWLRAADVFVLSSTSEGLPISLLEAMAAGLPAIVTEVGALPEVVTLSGAGRIVPVRDVACLANAIVDLANRRQELAALGERASRCYHAHFTPDRMAGEYLTLYRACLRHGVRRAPRALERTATFAPQALRRPSPGLLRRRERGGGPLRASEPGCGAEPR
jgi:SAM-dependent methyltransferase